MITAITRRTALCAFTLAAAQALAAPFPDKPVTIMVPYPPGGLSDAVARAVAEPLSKELGQPVIVENLGGVSGAIAAQKVLNAPADGYYLFQGSPNELILSPLANSSVKFKSEDFRLVHMIGEAPLMIVTRKDLPANSADDLVKLARSSSASKPLTFASVGPGSLYHVLGEHLGKTIGANMTHVPYRGGGPLMQDLAGGQVDFVMLPLSQQQVGMANAGHVKILGTLSPKRLESVEKVPSVSEGKLIPKFNYSIWTGYLVKQGTPEAVTQRLHAALAKVLQDPKMRGILQVQNVIPAGAHSLEAAASTYVAETKMLRSMAASIALQAQ